MTPFDYVESRADADELIQEFGSAVQVRRVSSNGDPFKPILTPSDAATYAARVAFTWKQYQGGKILDGDQRWLVAAGPLAAGGRANILPGDVIMLGSTPLKIETVETLRPADVVVMFDCHCRPDGQ